jgi:formamidopyrimidine-DNA glycosylase
MPELPEVETVARQLAPCVAGQRVRQFRILDPRLRDGSLPTLTGRTIESVTRSGKRVLFRCSPRAAADRPVWLAVHLRMTGRLIYIAHGTRAETAHLRARIRLDRGSVMFYDTRRFGTFHGFRSEAEALPVGLDPLSPSLTPGVLRRLIGDSGQNIKAWLLRQDRLVGLGNIYASEILHAARISPERRAGSVSAEELARLLRATRTILRRAIGNCGTTFSDFQDTRGVTGSYQRYLRAYGREDEPCSRCRAAVRRIVQQQRSTFFCPVCQRVDASGP